MGHIIIGAEITHRIHLVLHKSYQRGDHDCGPRFHHSRQLIAERLPSACGHQHKGVAAFQHILDNGFLIPFECIESEISLQIIMYCCIRCHLLP